MSKKIQIARQNLLSTLAAAPAGLTFVSLLPAETPVGTTMGTIWLQLDALVSEGLIEELSATEEWPVARYVITGAGELALVQYELISADWL